MLEASREREREGDFWEAVSSKKKQVIRIINCTYLTVSLSVVAKLTSNALNRVDNINKFVQNFKENFIYKRPVIKTVSLT